MSEEQKEILQMVSDGKITADDGAKLLEALKVGEQKRRENESPARRVKEMKRRMHEIKAISPLSGLGGMREIGRMMRGIMRESVSGIEDHEFVEIDEDMMEDEGYLEGPIEFDEGTELVLKRRVRRNGMNSSGNLILNGVEGSTLEAIGEDSPIIRFYRDNGTVYLKWDKGDLSLNVPETVEKVRASIMGGNIDMNSVTAAADMKTMGGDINLSEVSRAFRVKTMGGSIMIKLTDDWNEDSRVVTMGGNIALDICASTKAIISARTMGGEITIPDDVSEYDESGHPGSSRVNIDLSEGEDAPELRIKTMGGNIMINRSGTEPVEEENVKKKRSGKRRNERK